MSEYKLYKQLFQTSLSASSLKRNNLLFPQMSSIVHNLTRSQKMEAYQSWIAVLPQLDLGEVECANLSIHMTSLKAFGDELDVDTIEDSDSDESEESVDRYEEISKRMSNIFKDRKVKVVKPEIRHATKSGISHNESGISHNESGISHEAKSGISHMKSGISHEEAGTSHETNEEKLNRIRSQMANDNDDIMKKMSNARAGLEAHEAELKKIYAYEKSLLDQGYTIKEAQNMARIKYYPAAIPAEERTPEQRATNNLLVFKPDTNVILEENPSENGTSDEEEEIIIDNDLPVKRFIREPAYVPDNAEQPAEASDEAEQPEAEQPEAEQPEDETDTEQPDEAEASDEAEQPEAEQTDDTSEDPGMAHNKSSSILNSLQQEFTEKYNQLKSLGIKTPYLDTVINRK
jgi:hypothetical protein